MQLYDIHSHTLPGIDDGSTSWEETMTMIQQATATGTTDLAITHHILHQADYEKEDEILEKFEQLKRKLKEEEIPLNLHLAAELYYQHDLDVDHRISTYNDNKRYFLVEFPMQGIPKYCDEKFFEFIMEGKTPILAHPERNLGIVRNPMRAYEFVQRGVLLQLNSGSLNGMYGETVRQVAISLLDAGLIHFVGSDGHNATRRPLVIGDAHEFIVDRYGEEMAVALFHKNPWRAMHGDEIRVPEPVPVEVPKKKKGFGLRRMLGF